MGCAGAPRVARAHPAKLRFDDEAPRERALALPRRSEPALRLRAGARVEGAPRGRARRARVRGEGGAGRRRHRQVARVHPAEARRRAPSGGPDAERRPRRPRRALAARARRDGPLRPRLPGGAHPPQAPGRRRADLRRPVGRPAGAAPLRLARRDDHERWRDRSPDGERARRPRRLPRRAVEPGHDGRRPARPRRRHRDHLRGPDPRRPRPSHRSIRRRTSAATPSSRSSARTTSSPRSSIAT